MKILLALIISMISTLASSYEIEGTQVLKGSLKTEIIVESLKTTCKVKIEDVKNLLEEDQYGNPGYKIKVDLSLNGGEFLSPKKVKFDKTIFLTNLFSDGVRDLEYFGSEVNLKIKNDGRLSEIRFPYKYNTVICRF